MKLAVIGRTFVLAGSIVLGSVMSVEAAPLSCAALRARLVTKLVNDTGIGLRPTFSKSESDYPAVSVIDIKSDDIREGYIWCKKTDQSVAQIEVSFTLANMLLPSKSADAEAIVADIVCTLMKAEMEDCDAVVRTMAQSATEASAGMDVKIHLAPGDWVFTADRDSDDLTFDFDPGDNSSMDPHRIDLRKSN